jgi:hypothetical protein
VSGNAEQPNRNVVLLNRGSLCAAVCIGFGTLLLLTTVVRTSITVDEPYFYRYGRRIFFAGTFTRTDPIDNSKLPVSALNALPAWVAARCGIGSAQLRAGLKRWFMPREAMYIAENLGLYAGRVVTVVFYVTLCWLVFAWGRDLYGSSGGLAATALIGFLPTLLGHAALVTVDAAATCTMFATVYAMARCLAVPERTMALLAGIALGTAQLVKYTAVELIPIAIVMLFIRTATAEGVSRGQALRTGGVSLLLALGAALVVINLGFAFQRSGVRLNDLPCHTRVCQGLRGLFGNFPLPVPYEFLNGLDLVTFQDQAGVGGGSVYLLGQLNRKGFASYYAIATLLKTPLPFLALLLMRPWRRERLYTDLVLLLPVVWLLVHLSFFFHTQLGLRYFLPAFPFLAVLAAANWEHERPWQWRLAASILLGVYMLTTVIECPRYLSYFNCLIGPRLNAYRYLADSNLDWGQDLFQLWAWERAHTGQPYALEPYFPAQGLVIVRVNDFVGINDPEAYAWLRARATPVATIGDSYLVFDVNDGSPRPAHGAESPPVSDNEGVDG